MNEMNYVSVTVNTFSVVVCLLILFFVAISDQRKEKRSRIFLSVIGIHLLTLLAAAAKVMMQINAYPVSGVMNMLLIIVTPVSGPVLVALLTYLILTILREKTGVSVIAVRAVYVVLILCAADIVGTVIFRSQYPFSPEGSSQYLTTSIWFVISQFLSIACIVMNAGLLVAHRKLMSKKELLALFSYVGLPVLAIIIHLFTKSPIEISMSITIATIIYYAGIQSDLSAQLKQKECELAEGRISVMLS